MFTNKIEKQSKKDEQRRKSEEFKRLFDAISELPVCILLNPYTVLNTVNGISIDHDVNSSGSGLSTKVNTKVNNGWHTLDLKSTERILANWTVMSKNYMFLKWAPEMESGAATDNSETDINAG